MFAMDLIFYLTLGLFILLFGTIDNNIDFDFWARLTVGKSFMQTGDLFNFDFQSWGATHEFIDHEWGSSIIFYLIQNYTHDIGLFLFKSIIIFLTFYTITKIIRLEDKKIPLHFLFFFFAIHAISYNIFSTIRCQTFSFLFITIYLYILRKTSINKNYRILWCLPVLNIIWTNLHGGFVIGLILIFIFTIGEYLNKKNFKPYLIAFLACCATCLINPYGIKYITFIVSALTLNREHISEWQSMFFSKIYKHSLLKFELYFYCAITLFIYSVFKNIKLDGIKNFYNKIDKTKYLIILFTILISLKSMRFHVFFIYTLISYCYCDFYNIFNKKLPAKIDKLKEIILLVLILISTTSHIMEYKFINTVKPSQYPIYCVEFIKINNLKGNIFTNFHTGSYVSYKLYPDNKIFMDGRYEEVYDTNLINEMSDVFLAKNYKKFFEKYHTDIIIADKYYPLYKNLKNDLDWFLAYEDKYFALFLKKDQQKKFFKYPLKSLQEYNKEKFKTNINWL